jgi:hypothetical protein
MTQNGGDPTTRTAMRRPLLAQRSVPPRDDALAAWQLAIGQRRHPQLGNEVAAAQFGEHASVDLSVLQASGATSRTLRA